jgi:ABC-2 type transport system permease protein
VFGSTGNVRLKIGVVDLDGSPMSQAIVQGIIQNFEGIPEIEISTGTEDEERAALKDDDRNGIIIIPPGLGDRVASRQQADVTIIINESEISTAQVTSSTLRGIVEEINQKMSGTPQLITVNEEAAQGVEDFEYIDFMVPGILAMVLMFGGLAGYSLEIASYREKGILRRIKVSPLSLPTFLAGGIASVLVYTLLQTVLLLAVGILAFGLNLNGSYLYMAVIVTIGALSFLALGFLIASLTKNMRSAGLASQAIALPMMFLSGIFFPLEIVPTALKVIARCLPLYYLGDALREVMIDSASLLDVWLDILVLVVIGVVAFIASVRFFRWE